MSSMGMTFGLGFVPARRERAESQSGDRFVVPQRAVAAEAAGPNIQEMSRVKRRIEDLELNELLYQALYGDLSQFSVDV